MPKTKTKKRATISSKYTGKMDSYEENIKLNMRNKLLSVFNEITKNIDDKKYKNKLLKILEDYFSMIQGELVNKLIAKYGMINNLEKKLLEFYGRDKNISNLGNELKKMSKTLMMKPQLTEDKSELEECAKKYANKIKI